MAKLTSDLVLDAACNYIKNNVTEIYVCATQPTTRATAISNALASRTGLSSASFTGPANGDLSGRKITKNAESGISVTANGTGDHVAMCSGTDLIQVTTMTSQVLTSGNTVNIPAYDVEFADVTQ
jgi:hypothetical protein